MKISQRLTSNGFVNPFKCVENLVQMFTFLFMAEHGVHKSLLLSYESWQNHAVNSHFGGKIFVWEKDRIDLAPVFTKNSCPLTFHFSRFFQWDKGVKLTEIVPKGIEFWSYFWFIFKAFGQCMQSSPKCFSWLFPVELSNKYKKWRKIYCVYYAYGRVSRL